MPSDEEIRKLKARAAEAKILAMEHKAKEYLAKAEKHDKKGNFRKATMLREKANAALEKVKEIRTRETS